MSKIKLKPEAIRTNKGLSQKEFCDMLGISTRVYWNRLNKKTEWKTAEITKMCEIGNIKASQLDI